MKIKSFLYLIVSIAILTISGRSHAQNNSKDPQSFHSFYKKDTTKVTKGYYTVYEEDEKYYLEIPVKGINRDILITTQVTRGYSAFVSPSSGVIHFSKGRDNTLNVIKKMSREVSADSTDLCMVNAIRKSGLIPIVKSFKVVAYGADGQSPIIDLTSELNSPSGLFDVSSNLSMNSPDPSRSGVENYKIIDNGIVFSVKRSQTYNYINPQNKKNEDVVNSFLLEMVIQEIPEHPITLKKDHPAYGFNTIILSEYDSKRYATFRNNYIQRWQLNPSPTDKRKQRKGETVKPQRPICVYIDSVVPAPFRESIEKAIEAWNDPFIKAGWKKVFRLSHDKKDSSLSYKTILFKWGNSYNDNSTQLITNDVNGEILCARINLMDEKAQELLNRYFLQCSNKDSRILKDIYSLDIRKEIVSAQVEALIATVLGLKANNAASTAFSPANLRSDQWLTANGNSASITSEFTFNYVARPEDKISLRNLMPRISVYDYDAIAYAYGESLAAPRLKSTNYVELDKSDPYAQSFATNDIIEASSDGLKALQSIYPKINALVNQLPANQNTWALVSDLTKVSFSLYSAYLYQIGNMVGGRSIRPIIQSVNDVPVTYVTKAEQLKALEYLKDNLFANIPTWLKRDSLLMASSIDAKDYLLGTNQMIFEEFVSKETINSLIGAEELMGEKAFTCNDLFNYFDHVIFADFDKQKSLSDYQQNVQACLISKLISSVTQSNIGMGVTDESAVLHCYFIRTADQIKKLSMVHADPSCRSYYQLMMVKMNREYFDK